MGKEATYSCLYWVEEENRHLSSELHGRWSQLSACLSRLLSSPRVKKIKKMAEAKESTKKYEL